MTANLLSLLGSFKAAMDVQPSLSPFNPALSYSLLVDDLFNLEYQGMMMVLSDEEACDEDYNNNLLESSNIAEEAPMDGFFPHDFNDNPHACKTPDVTCEADVMEEQTMEEIIVFDPHISEGKKLMNLELMDAFKENINNCFPIKCHLHSEEAKPCLLSSLCLSIDQSPKSASPMSNDFPSHQHLTSSSLLSFSGHLTPMLPPCRVCGEKASGFHYGANTCEACKGFFRRSLQRKQNYRCIGSNDCDIKSGKRNVCAACRYRKCLSLGMSKNAIKTGRYTHAKKTKDIQEVKRLQRKQQMMTLKDDQFINSFTSDSYLDFLDDDTAEKIVDKIMGVHRQQTPHTPEFFEKLPQKEHDYLIRRKLKEEMFGPLRPISRDEYSNIYHCTGIDVDGRKAMLEHMLPCIEGAVKRFVTFAKAVPGFKELPLEDQIKLIKGSRFEAWLISSYRAFNPEYLLYTHYCGSTVHLENMARLYDEHFLRDVFKMVGDIKKLDLTEEEECMLKAILIFFRDRSLLQDPELVDVHQMRLIKALEFVHQKRKPKDRIFLGRVSAILTEMRTLTDMHTTQENKIQVEWATDVPIPPLLYELFYV